MQDKPLYTLNKLRAIDDSEDFILQVINIFLETVPANTASLVEACNNEDWEQVYFFAHKIKANVNLLEMESITEDVKFVEESAKGLINLDMIIDKVIKIESTIKITSNEMKINKDKIS